MIELIPEDNSGISTGQIEELVVETDAYVAGVLELRTRVPEGWRIMNLRRGD